MGRHASWRETSSFKSLFLYEWQRIMFNKLIQGLFLAASFSLVGCNVGKTDTVSTTAPTTPATTGNAYQGTYDTLIARPGDIGDDPEAHYLAGAANFIVKADGTVTNETPNEGSVIIHGYRMEIGGGSTVNAQGVMHLNFNAIGGGTGITVEGTITAGGVVSGVITEVGTTSHGWMSGKRRAS